MTNVGDILDTAAFLALRVDARRVRPDAPLAEYLTDTLDALSLLREQWHWSLAIESLGTAIEAKSLLPSTALEFGQSRAARTLISPEISRQRGEVVIEVLVTELLIRVCTVLFVSQGCTARDDRVKQLVDQLSETMNDMARFARQQFMLVHPDFSWSLKLYRLQKRLDRWSDILLAPILIRGCLDRFWINRAHVDDWADHPWNRMADRDAAGLLLRRAIQSTVPAEDVIPASRVRHVERLLAATLMLVPNGDFTNDGILMSLAQCRGTELPPGSHPTHPH